MASKYKDKPEDEAFVKAMVLSLAIRRKDNNNVIPYGALPETLLLLQAKGIEATEAQIRSRVQSPVSRDSFSWGVDASFWGFCLVEPP